MSDKQLIRSFIAIEIPPEVKSNISELQARMRSGKQNFIKWVSPESIHITLKFLGNITHDKVAEIENVMRNAGLGLSTISIEIGGLGAFPNINRPRVFWLGIGGDVGKLVNLQQVIDNSLIPLGFQREKRPFSPHITLARVRDTATNYEQRDFGELILKTDFEVKSKVKIDSIRLMRSQLLPQGAVYSLLAEVKFNKD